MAPHLDRRGGMYIELVIASICTFIWWFTEPGMLNQLCLSTMFVCSVSTVMFNANPLLRYDGYYILSDLLEIPNLRQKATPILNRKLSPLVPGPGGARPTRSCRSAIRSSLPSIRSPRRFIAGSSRFSIFWFLYEVLEPYGLKVISQMIATASIISLVVQPLWKLGKFFYIPGRLEKVKRKHVQVTLAVLAAVALFVFALPLPHRVFCPLEIKPRDAESGLRGSARPTERGPRVDPASSSAKGPCSPG